MINSSIKLLIADTNKPFLRSFEDMFKESGFDVITSVSGEETIEKALMYLPQIILLDIVLKGKDGIETCSELRTLEKLKKSIIIFYTNSSEDYSQIAAFNAGADDYVVRPVKANVLKSRMHALLKRFNHQNDLLGNKNKTSTGILIDRERYIVFRDGEEVILPRKEFELLALLNSSPRKVFTREEISKVVWGYDTQSHNRTIDVHVRKLRQKLGKRFIKTVKGVGYSVLP